MQTVTRTPQTMTPIAPERTKHVELSLPTLKVISYRGPGQSGGVPASLEPVVKRLGAKVNWFSISGVPSEPDITASQSHAFAFHNPEIPQSLIDKHNQIAAGYLWPLLHGMPEKAHFDHENWKSFRQLSEFIASEVLKVSSESFPTLCWLHDYQLALVAPLMAMQAGVVLTQFWHVPWPKAEIMVGSPVVRELVESLLSNKVLGFHTEEYAANFLETVRQVMPNAIVDTDRMEVMRRRQFTKIVVMPLGIDFALWQNLAEESKQIASALSVKHNLSSQVVLGVDRLDYSKGVLEKLHGIERFLENNPDAHRRFHYVQIAQQPQARNSNFDEYADAVHKKVADMNAKFAFNGWQPIVFINEVIEQIELAAWYQAADVISVNSVADGLNLIAKEFVATRNDEQGVLLLSNKAGCAAELASGALLVEPTDADEFASQLACALKMDVEEKRRRMTLMRRLVGWNQLHDWAIGFLSEAIGKK